MADDCRRCREALSALLDGEDPGWPDHRIDDHLEGCGDCEHFAQAIQHPSFRTALVGSPTHDEWVWPRSVLLLVAVVLGAIALVSLVAASGEHASREVAGLELALAIGMAAVALRPQRARALVPVLVTVAAVVAWSAIVDVAGGVTSVFTEAHHGLELSGAALVIVLARRHFTDFRQIAGFER